MPIYNQEGKKMINFLIEKKTEITSPTLQSGITTNSIRDRNCTNSPDLISYSTQDPQFLINPANQRGKKVIIVICELKSM